MAAGAIRTQPGAVSLALLRQVGVDEAVVRKINDVLQEGRRTDIDAFGQVGLGTLKANVSALGLNEPSKKALLERFKQLDELMTTHGTAPLAVQGAGAKPPVPALSIEAPRAHAARVEGGKLSLQELGGAAGAVESFLGALKPPRAVADVGASELLAMFDSSFIALRSRLSNADIDRLKTVLASKNGPAYAERDGKLSLDSTFARIATAKGPEGFALYHESGYEGLFARRGADPTSFTISGHRTDKVFVVLPPGTKPLLIDADGDQRALGGLKTVKRTIDGKEVTGIEISRELVQPSSRRSFVSSPSFTLKLLNAKNESVHEQALTFGRYDPNTTLLFRGKVGAVGKPPGASIGDDAWSRYVPSAKDNAVPCGERPLLSFDGQPPVDRLLIQRDGETFRLDRLSQLIYPHGGQQTVRVTTKDGKTATYQLRGISSEASNLDRAERDPPPPVRITDSFGHGVTFDRSLGESNQARFTFRGVVIESPHSGSEIAVLDVLTPKKKSA